MIFHEEARHNSSSRGEGHVKLASMQARWQDLLTAVEVMKGGAWRRLPRLVGACHWGGAFRAGAASALGLDGNGGELDGLDVNNDGRRDAG